MNTQAAAPHPDHARREHTVQRADLPLACPLPSMALWNAHPRVYLPIEAEGGRSECPYCGAVYLLAD